MATVVSGDFYFWLSQLIVFFNIFYFVITVRNSIAFARTQVVLHYDNTEVPFGKYNWSMHLKVL